MRAGADAPLTNVGIFAYANFKTDFAYFESRLPFFAYFETPIASDYNSSSSDSAFLLFPDRMGKINKTAETPCGISAVF